MDGHGRRRVRLWWARRRAARQAAWMLVHSRFVAVQHGSEVFDISLLDACKLGGNHGGAFRIGSVDGPLDLWVTTPTK